MEDEETSFAFLIPTLGHDPSRLQVAFPCWDVKIKNNNFQNHCVPISFVLIQVVHQFSIARILITVGILVIVLRIIIIAADNRISFIRTVSTAADVQIFIIGSINTVIRVIFKIGITVFFNFKCVHLVILANTKSRVVTTS